MESWRGWHLRYDFDTLEVTSMRCFLCISHVTIQRLTGWESKSKWDWQEFVDPGCCNCKILKWPNVCEQTLRLRQSIVFLSYSSISCVLGNTSYIIIPEYTKLENHCNLFMLINIPLVCLVSLQGGAPSYKLVPSHYRYLIWFVHHSRTCTADKATSPTAWGTQLRSGDPIISLWNIMMCRWSWMTMDDYVQFHHLNL